MQAEEEMRLISQQEVLETLATQRRLDLEPVALGVGSEEASKTREDLEEDLEALRHRLAALRLADGAQRTMRLLEDLAEHQRATPGGERRQTTPTLLEPGAGERPTPTQEALAADLTLAAQQTIRAPLLEDGVRREARQRLEEERSISEEEQQEERQEDLERLRGQIPVAQQVADGILVAVLQAELPLQADGAQRQQEPRMAVREPEDLILAAERQLAA